MADRLCYRCDDEGGSCCSAWCYQRGNWWFIRCDHYECWEKNGKRGLPPGHRDKKIEQNEDHIVRGYN